MSKKKVLFLVNHDVVIYNFRKEIVEKLLSEGYEVIISSPYGERIDELVKMGCKFVEVSIDRHGKNIIKELSLIRHYDKLIQKILPDILLGFTIKPNIYGAFIARKYKIPFVANITGLGTAVENGGALQKLSVFLYKIAFSEVQTVFLQNSENQKFFADNNIALSKHKMLPGSGVNLKQFLPLEYPDEDTIEFVFISRIMKQKGIDQYLDAAKQITKEYPNTRFHICGFCEEDYEGILNKYHDEGTIIYHGMLKDIREILKITHCTVHPTYYPEGISNVLLESAACERPIITTDRSGTREVVDNGINGLLVESKSSEDLINKLKLFISFDYEKKKFMGKNGRKKIIEEFDRELVVEAYLNELPKD